MGSPIEYHKVTEYYHVQRIRPIHREAESISNYYPSSASSIGLSSIGPGGDVTPISLFIQPWYHDSSLKPMHVIEAGLQTYHETVIRV